MGTSPIDFALLGETGNRLKSKTTAKLKGKQATFPTHLLSHYKLPLIVHFSFKVLDLFI
jgi:hypothetical protein